MSAPRYVRIGRRYYAIPDPVPPVAPLDVTTGGLWPELVAAELDRLDGGSHGRTDTAGDIAETDEPRRAAPRASRGRRRRPAPDDAPAERAAVSGSGSRRMSGVEVPHP